MLQYEELISDPILKRNGKNVGPCGTCLSNV